MWSVLLKDPIIDWLPITSTEAPITAYCSTLWTETFNITYTNHNISAAVKGFNIP